MAIRTYPNNSRRTIMTYVLIEKGRETVIGHKQLNQTRNELHAARRTVQTMLDADPAAEDFRQTYNGGWQDFINRTNQRGQDS